MSPWILVAIVAAITALWVGQRIAKERRRAEAIQRQLSADEQRWVAAAVRQYKHLPAELKQRLNNHVKLFLDEKRFEGCDGFELELQHCVMVAASACYLCIGREEPPFANTSLIQLYPSAFVTPARPLSLDGNPVHHGDTRLGESSHMGIVVLSWPDVEAGFADRGTNVVLHEFAHQLDQADGLADGTPELEESNYRQWGAEFSRAFLHLRSQIEQRLNPSLDPYGATNEAEFFAVVSEAFFDQPTSLRRDFARVFELLQRYYRYDPINLRAL